MQDDILVKRPPASPPSASEVQDAKADIQQEAAIDPPHAVDSAMPKNPAPTGVITLAIFICLCLVFAAVYGALNR